MTAEAPKHDHRIQAFVTPEVYADLLQMAAHLQTSLSHVVRLLLTEGVERRKEDRKWT